VVDVKYGNNKMTNHKQCTCPNCTNQAQVTMQVMIGHPTMPPQPVGMVIINTNALLVEEWMLEKVALDAVASLGKYIVQSNQGKTEH
jgi:hypothetical protein